MWSAIVAALTGTITFLWQYFDRHDSFVLRWGPMYPQLAPGTYLYVVNTSKHEIMVRDYGFLDSKWAQRSWSLPDEAGQHEFDFHLLPVLPSRGQYQAGFDASSTWDTAYAITTTQSRPRLAFRDDVPQLRRLRVRLRMAWKGQSALWS